MKKSYIKLIIFSFVLMIIFLLSMLKYHFLNQNILNILLLFLLVITYFLFGFEKDKHRYIKDVILELSIIIISFFLVYYFSGLLIGFARTKNYLTISSLKDIIFPIILYIIIKEYFRYQLLMKASLSKKLTLLVILLFIIMDSIIPLSSHTFGLNREIFLVFAISIMPSISDNILCTFLSRNFGYLPSIFYLLIMKLTFYLIPIVPNPNEYLYSIIFFIIPFIILKILNNWLSKAKDEENNLFNYSKSKFYLVGYGSAIIILVILIYFVSGYFRYYTVAIASGSMREIISRGDIVVVDKKNKNLKKNDIIAYKHDGKIVVHRIHKMIDIGKEKFIYTKGDANSNSDQYKITEDMVIGVVKFKIPLLGYPTVLLNEQW